ncbi:lytic polysaccharide monooxygenase [Nocardiopsis ansamitocini]|uniref:Chitin-binding protein n=1 Tax=Nocardiopsis ansamitocini TaxID=1670832 RepID=A0A9W6UJ67_9ACTN|nr:lytic polysaccharide monooxygenase [Nocardiopsis ansamitocini]GLU48422.1 chitin-binding protein [Nocardiopsis ansamitocini]
MRTRSRIAALAAAVGLAAGALVALPAPPAEAHGGLTLPATRTYACYLDGIAGGLGGNVDPTNPVCRDALNEGGNYAFYNWFGNLISNAGGRHREIIPDGKLCGPTASFDSFNAVSEHWPTTTLQSGADITFQYNAWAPHPGTWYQYITKDNWNPNTPLAWDDLEPVPFDQVTDPPLRQGGPEGAEYYWDAELPVKSGRHIIYSIWQRSDSPEAFYNCSDVVFEGSTNPGPPDTQAPTAPGTPTVGTITGNSAQLSWTAATDNTAVTSYTVHNATTDAVLATTPNTSATVTGLSPNTQYEVYVVAHDAAGNNSPASANRTFTTGSPPENPCVVDYQTPNPWSGGFTGQVSVFNDSHTPVNGWTLEWDFTNGEVATNGWNSTLTQTGASVSVKNAAWNAVIPHHGSVSFGFNANAPAGPKVPTDFRLNGTTCTVE